MSAKPGRNDPCPCGSGKKYKQCCAQKDKPATKRKIKAVMLSSAKKKEAAPNVDQGPDLIKRTFQGSFEPKQEDQFEPTSSSESPLKKD